MKKIFTLIAATAMLAVSCQKETPATDNTGSSSTPGKLTATIVKASTKVTYSETPELNLQPAWEVGDEIIGFDDAGNTYTLTVASVAAETATLNGTVPDGALHLIYKSGAKASDISAKALAVDYTAQAGDKTMPAVMLADGTVENGSCNFAFKNAGAIIGISAVKGVPSGATISKITISGSNLSAATIALSGSALALTAATAASDAISTAALSGITTIDADGTLSSPVFIAVPANATIAKVSAFVTKEPETMKIPSMAADKEGVDYVSIEAKYDGTNVTTKKWAKWNVGANSQSEYGWYFAWGGTEGYVRQNNKWVSASGVDSYSYSLSSAKTAGANDYLYVKNQSFAGHSFDWAHAPFNNGSSSCDATYFSSVRNTVCPDNILALDYDAARVNWGGNWRMPTSAEFKAMKDATYWAWNATDKGYYVFSPDDSHTAGTSAISVPGDLNKADALLFFPAAGYGGSAGLSSAGSGGRYWSGSFFSSGLNNAFYLHFYSGTVNPQTNLSRCNGHSVRPVSD